LEPAANLLYCPLRNLLLILLKLKCCKEIIKGIYAHIHKFRYALSGNLYILHILAQTAAVTLPAGCLSGITSKHIFVLDLVLLALYHIKEAVDASKVSVSTP